MSEVAKEYGRALFELTEEEGLTEALAEEISAVLSLFLREEDYLRLLSAPGISGEEKREALTRAFHTAHPYLLNFLLMLTERGYAREIPACLEEYGALRREARGIALAEVESAVKLTAEERKALIEALARRYGRTVELTERINPALIGGARIYIEGQLLDGSLRHRLDGLGDRLAKTVL